MSTKEMRELEEIMDKMAYAYCERMENPNITVEAKERKWKKFHQNLLAKQC